MSVMLRARVCKLLSIVDATSFLLPVIIVGIEDANFANVEELDSVEALLCDARGRKNPATLSTRALLAKEVLAEVPPNYQLYASQSR
jgi:hypothetical protein